MLKSATSDQDKISSLDTITKNKFKISSKHRSQTKENNTRQSFASRTSVVAKRKPLFERLLNSTDDVVDFYKQIPPSPEGQLTRIRQVSSIFQHIC